MSKCKAVLDGERITEIRVKTKAQGTPPDKPRRKGSSAPKK